MDDIDLTDLDATTRINPQPAAPAYNQGYTAPQQTAYTAPQQPSTPVYNPQPAAPTYNPGYTAPQQTAYTAPQQPSAPAYNPQPAAPAYNPGYTAPQQTAYTAPTPAKKSKGPLIGGIIGAVVAVIAVVVVLFLYPGVLRDGYSSPEAAVKAYCKGLADHDAKKLVNSMPEAIIDLLVEEEGYDSKDEMIKDLQEEADEEKDEKITYKIGDKKQVDKDDLEEITFYLSILDIDMNIDDAYIFDVTLADDYYEDNTTITALKTDGRWYAFPDIF